MTKELFLYYSCAERSVTLQSNYQSLRADMSYKKWSLIAISLFEHIRDVAPLVEKVYGILRPGGHFLVGMPRVDCFMKFAFPFLAYYNIDEQHVTTYRQFLDFAQKKFKLVTITHMPRCLPRFLGLYYNMLFSKG